MPYKDIEKKREHERLYKPVWRRKTGKYSKHKKVSELTLEEHEKRKAQVRESGRRWRMNHQNERKTYSQSLKKRAVEYKGNKCARCGETFPQYVYDFHHLNSSEKDQNIAALISGVKSWEIIKKELDKCLLLCANCHRIIEWSDNNNA